MNRMFAIAVLFLAAGPASAQHHHGPGLSGGFTYRSQYQYQFSSSGPGYRFSSYSCGFYAAPIVPLYYSYGWVPSYGPGYGPGFGNPFFLPQPPFAGPILPIANNVPVNPEANGVVPALAVKGEFLVITPKGSSTKRGGEGGTISPMVDRVATPERSVPPVFRFDPFADRRVLGQTDRAEPDPKAEALRQVNRAREALKLEEYGQAVEHLDRALRAQPDDATAVFMKGQAQFAAGQFVEAVATIRDGIERSPNWPARDFKPKELFGKPERFEAQLTDLRKALAANPTQPALQFLLAHQLWFTGERVDAIKLFRDLATRLNDPRAIEPFLAR